MPDVLTPQQRRRCMSRVKDRDTGPEVTLRKGLWSAGMRYRLRYKLPGKPDLVFISRRVVVFVDGCFWHCCPIHATHPKTNERFWHDKLESNRRRDQQVNEVLMEQGWRVLRFWEHEVNQNLDAVINRIADRLNTDNVSPRGGQRSGRLSA